MKTVLDTLLPLLPGPSLSTLNPTLVSYTPSYPWAYHHEIMTSSAPNDSASPSLLCVL